MFIRSLIAIAVVFVVWSGLDYVIHQHLLMDLYEQTDELWVAPEEMKMGLMMFVTLVVSCAFVGIYSLLISPKTPFAGLRLGLLFGLAGGMSMGYGLYAVMPIPYWLALGWFLGTLVESTIAGILTGLIVRPSGRVPL